MYCKSVTIHRRVVVVRVGVLVSTVDAESKSSKGIVDLLSKLMLFSSKVTKSQIPFVQWEGIVVLLSCEEFVFPNSKITMLGIADVQAPP